MARYGRQQIWPEGLLEAPWNEVEAIADEIAELVKIENKASSEG
jgi:hypothetical protein